MSVKIFISSRMEEFAKERTGIAQMLVGEMGLIPVYFENEPAGGHLPSWWRRRIADSDVYLLLLGKDLSWSVADEILSAKRLARPTIILISEPSLLVQKRLRIVESRYWVQKDIEVKELYDYLSSQKWKEFSTFESLKTEVRAGVARYLRVQSGVPLDMVVDRDRIEKIREVFVEPCQYANARELLSKSNLAIVCGPPHVGKTAMALRLLGESVESSKAITVVELRNVSDIGMLRYVHNIAVLLDDVFGAVQPEVENYADRWEELEAVARNNIVVATSRNEVLEAAFYETKLATRVLREQTITLDANSYSTNDREKMVRNHLAYWESAGRKFQKREIILKQASHIARELHFPHNIAYFIEFYGHVIQDRKELFHYVAKSKVIEEEIAKWISRIDRDIRLFVVVVALYEAAYDEAVSRAYEELCARMMVTRIPQGEILEKIHPYVILDRTWRFRHPSYRLAVLDRAYEMYGAELLNFMGAVVSDVMSDLDLGSKTKKTLGIFGIRHPIEALHELHRFMSSDGELDRDARVAVRAIGQKHPYKTLEELLSWPSSKSVFRLVGGIVSRLSHRPIEEVDGWAPLLTKAIAHPNPAFRWRIANLIQRFASRKPREALPLVIKLSIDESPKVRKAAVTAAQALGAKIPDKALKLLKNMNQDPDESVRRHVTGRIAEIESRLKNKTGNFVHSN
jgi:hypothetical protein